MNRWAELESVLSDEQKSKYLRSIFEKDESFDPLHDLSDAWGLTESRVFANSTLERNRDKYYCYLFVGDIRIDGHGKTSCESIVSAMMKAYEAGVRVSIH